MNVNDKIKQILIDKSLSPSVFADEIGVQRSSISHILSGRNRPSFDIIQKVIRRYPDLGYDWIMEDENQDDLSTSKTTRVRTPIETYQPTLRETPVQNQHRQRQPSGAITSEPAVPKVTVSSTQAVPVAVSEKVVERILIFYTDGTFREYTPAAFS